NDGNFHTLLRFKAYSGDHLHTSSLNATYISPHIQNEIVNACGAVIQRKLVGKIWDAKYFTVLADETTDISGVEQLSVCVRYVEHQVIETAPFTAYSVREDFWGFVLIYDLTGRNMSDNILKFLASVGDHGLKLSDMHGQGYDEASNMLGRVQDQYPTALYLHCMSHSLNLALTKCCSVAAIRNFLGTVSDICTFFQSSTQCISILKEQVGKFLLQTKKVEQHDSLITFSELLSPVAAALNHFIEHGHKECSSRARQFCCAIGHSEFLVALHCSAQVFSVSLPLSKYLQQENCDITSALAYVCSVKDSIDELQSDCDTTFCKVFEDVQSSAHILGEELQIPRLGRQQQHRPNHPAEDNAEQYFRRSVYIPFLDYFLSELDCHFTAHSRVLSGFNSISPVYLAHGFTNLVKFYESDLDSESVVFAEIKLWGKWKNTAEKTKSVILALAQCDALFYPNVHKLLQILVTLLVSTACPERSFSSLRRLKTYLHNMTTENQIVGLALLNIHWDIPVNSNEVIDRLTTHNQCLNL
uniref:HAT C-terminal dimerisation domain-containing protein n=1 Tax=Latimeria chalumnae TaxID=7897 RepID=H3BG50_LATCH